MPERLQATSLSEQECVSILNRLLSGRDGTPKGRFAVLNEAIKQRDAHFTNAKEADPKLAPPYSKRQVFQTDAIRRTYNMAMTRILEHEPAFHVEAKRKTQENRRIADAIETYLRDGLAQVETRNGYRLQGFMGHGQLLHCYGILRCIPRRASELPDRMVKDSIDGLQRENFTLREDGKYEETESARLARYRDQKAVEDFPFIIDSPRADTFAFIPDRTHPSGIAVGVTIEAVPFLDYSDEVKKDGIAVSMDRDKKLHVSMLAERPSSDDQSAGSDWGDVNVAQVWTATECYELISGVSGSEWSMVKSFKHNYGSTPFSIAPATMTNHPDPLYRYRPYLDGLFKTKPLFDMERNLGRLIAEETAIPRYWVELKEGGYWLDDSGQPLVLEQNSALAQRMPEGSRLVRADVKIEPAFVQFLERSKMELDEATPPVGYASEIGAYTQPHSIYMQQIQSNAPIADLKRKQARAMEHIFTMVIEQMARWADDGDPIVIQLGDGALVEPTAEQLRGLTVGVKIEENSGAQQVAKEQYLREKSKDPAAIYSTSEYLEETGREDKEAAFAQWLSEKARMRIWPQIVEQELIKAYGDAYVLTPAGTPVGTDGKPMSPLDILAQSGFQALATVTTGVGGMGSGAGQANAPLPATPPQFSDLQPMGVPAGMGGEQGMSLA